MSFYIKTLSLYIKFDRNQCAKIQENGICIYIVSSVKISYWRATTIAPIKAAKRIIEISSNGRKKSVDK